MKRHTNKPVPIFQTSRLIIPNYYLVVEVWVTVDEKASIVIKISKYAAISYSSLSLPETQDPAIWSCLGKPSALIIKVVPKLAVTR